MSLGRAGLLGLALASAVASRLAADSLDGGASASITAGDDGGSPAPAVGAPGVAIAAAAPALPAVVVSASLADAITAPPLPAATPPLRFAPKTSPPQA